MRLVLILVATVLCGCAYRSAAPDVLPFTQISSLKALNGTYRNQGIGAHPHAPTYLTALVWPSAPIAHESISEVYVKADDESTLHVSAYSDRKLVRESSFLNGHDFYFKNGTLTIKRGCRITGGEVGAMVAGSECQDLELGIDSGGDGKASSKETVVGLALLVFPVAATQSSEVRFVRVSQ